VLLLRRICRGVTAASPIGTGMQASAELYDPATGRWTPTASLRTPRLNYDPASGTWTRTGAMTDYHGFHAVRLHDGSVLVAGGGYAGDVYSPATDTWTATGPRVYGLHGGAAVALLPNGQVLSVGGSTLANCTPKGCGSEPVASAEHYTP